MKRYCKDCPFFKIIGIPNEHDLERGIISNKKICEKYKEEVDNNDFCEVDELTLEIEKKL